jgi:hypothetical protein
MPIVRKHYIVLYEADSHNVVWLIAAESIAEAMTRYCTGSGSDATVQSDGSIVSAACAAPVVYEHVLQYIESEYKSEGGPIGSVWEIRELRDEHWNASLAEVFCGPNPTEVADHVRRCKARFNSAFPRQRARAFVWYLRTGPLVTFHRRKRKSCKVPIEVIARYHLPWREPSVIEEFLGGFDEIIAHLAIEYPLPHGDKAE